MRHASPSSAPSAAVLLLIAIAGCGAPEGTDTGNAGNTPAPESAPPAATEPAAEPPSLDPCSLVSQAEVEQILGISVASPAPSVEPVEGVTYFSCSSDDVHVSVQAWNTPTAASSMFEFGTEYPAVEGLGERARNTQPLGEIEVLVGRYVVSVDLFTSLDREAELQAATEIARLVLTRLPE